MTPQYRFTKDPVGYLHCHGPGVERDAPGGVDVRGLVLGGEVDCEECGKDGDEEKCDECHECILAGLAGGGGER